MLLSGSTRRTETRAAITDREAERSWIVPSSAPSVSPCAPSEPGGVKTNRTAMTGTMARMTRCCTRRHRPDCTIWKRLALGGEYRAQSFAARYRDRLPRPPRLASLRIPQPAACRMRFRPLVTDEIDVDDPARSLVSDVAGFARQTRASGRSP